MKITELREQLEQVKGARFVGLTYTAKKHGEVARYTLLIGANYRKVCEDSILELEIRNRNATGIERFVIQDLISSLKESIRAMDEGREHVDYTKKGLYVNICQGLKIHINDGTCEVQGLQHAKTVIIPGEYKTVNHRSEETALKAAIRKDLSIGRFKTLCVDAGHLHSIRLNGETIEME